MLLAIFAPLFATHDPNASVLSDALLSPSTEHWFGTDRMGRDLFSRVIYGARTSLASTSILVLIVFFVGGALGTLAGYAGGMVGAGLTSAVLAITMITWTKYARLARSLVLKVRNMDYIASSLLSGSSHFTIITKHLLPTILPTLVITAATDMGGMMLELAAFSFLGLGTQSTSIEWGYMLNEGRQSMTSAPWLMLYPDLAVFITVVIFNLLGDSVRDVLDPKNTTNATK